MKKTLIIVGAIVVLIALYVGGTYNSLVRQNESIKGQWAQVENQYQRRFDLIPNLVSSVKGVMNQEKEIFTALADARTKYSGAVTDDAKAKAAGQVESSLGRLLAVVENYPTLKSSENVQSLMVQLEGTENRISVERKSYNDTILGYNQSIKLFPRSLIAGMFGFAEHAYFEVTAEAQVNPKVDLTN
ncbi:MAG: LemA family protein [Candidatus Pacebacteria bacterium]|nr:LemA family protein [Candidatus Paceibacterota bacterium]